jgi:hypothetical protein
MPKTNKSGGYKAAKNYEPRTPAKGAPKSGSRSPSHRGYKAVDETAPRKQRWNSDDRAARGAAPSSRGTERPSYDRADRPARPARDGERGGYDRGERTERPSYGDRPARGGYERPSRENGFHKSGTGTGRSERPSYDRGERPAYNRGERPAYNRGERPSYDRPSYDRAERPVGDGERRGHDRGQRTDRE